MRTFDSLAAFAAHLGQLAAMGTEVTDHIAGAAADRIRDDAKAKLGHYQPPAGPFPAWAPLSAWTMAERLELGFTANEPLLRSGQLRDAIERDVVHNGAVVGVKPGPHVEPDGRVEDVGQIALNMELGTFAPPRPFLGPAAIEAEKPIAQMAARTLVQWVAGKNWLLQPQSIKLP